MLKFLLLFLLIAQPFRNNFCSAHGDAAAPKPETRVKPNSNAYFTSKLLGKVAVLDFRSTPCDPKPNKRDSPIVMDKLTKLESSVGKLNLKVDDLYERMAQLSNAIFSKELPSTEKPELTGPTSKVTRSAAISEEPQFKNPPSNCIEATENSKPFGIYRIEIGSFENIWVRCETPPLHGRGWTVIQRRRDGSVDFFRNWNDYKAGFGNLDNEFWIGLDKLHTMTTTSRLHELLIIMEDFGGETRYAKYDSFAIGGEHENYTMSLLGKYTGNAGDDLRLHVGLKFSTKDRDNDTWDDVNCAESFKGAWWYHSCFNSNLNGKYFRGPLSTERYGQGVVWNSFRDNYSLKDVKMMIRPKVA